jgi:hypothetical protein
VILLSSDARSALRSRQRGFLLNPYRFGGGGAGSIVTAGLVMHLDAGNSSSFPGTGTIWANLVASPADGSGQADYDWTRGTGPAFNGSAGGMSAAEYFSTSGNEFFSLTAGTSGPQFLKDMHKTGAAWTVELWIYIPSISGGNVHPFFQSGVSDQGGSDNSRGVIYLDLSSLNNSGGKHQIRIRRDAGGASAFAAASDAGLTTGAVCQYALSYEADGTSFLYRNGDYDPVGGNDTFTATLSTPGSANPTNTPRMGTDQSTAQSLPTGSRFYIVRVYNAALTKAQLDQNWSANRGRFGL